MFVERLGLPVRQPDMLHQIGRDLSDLTIEIDLEAGIKQGKLARIQETMQGAITRFTLECLWGEPKLTVSLIGLPSRNPVLI